MTRRLVPAEIAAPLDTARSDYWTWTACVEGREPAELLHPRDREDLVFALVERGWTDRQIAEHTRMTSYTTVRIRERLGLRRNRHASAPAA